MKLAPEDEALLVGARLDLATYIGIVHKTDDGFAAIPPRHIEDIVIPALLDDTLGDTLIVAPFGSIKTNTMIGYLAWYLGNHPNDHVGYVCNSGPEAVERSLAVRDVVEHSPIYHAIYPDAVPNKDRGWAQDSWYLKRRNLMDKNPSFMAAGVKGGVIGKRLHRVILDDLADDDNQITHDSRQKIWTFLGETMKTRLDPLRGRAIMICTRWGEEDPAAWCLERGWSLVHIEAVQQTAKGQVSYWPERWPLHVPIPGATAKPNRLVCENEEHDQYGQCCWKKELGAEGFDRQMMGRITSEDSSLIKPSWWGVYDDLPDNLLRGVIVIDTAGWDNTSQHSDYAALSAWFTDGWNYYVADVEEDRWSFNEVEQVALNMRETWKLPIVVEDVPWARPLIQRLQKVTSGVIPWKVQGRAKLQRIEAVAPIIEAGRVFLPDSVWRKRWIDQHASVTRSGFGKHDDLVDNTSMALGYLDRNAGKTITPNTREPFRRRWEELSA